MREKTIEQKLTATVKQCGGICPKFTSPGFDGMPDRIVLLPHGRMAFVEVKAPGEKPRPLQEARHGMLRRLGFLRSAWDSRGKSRDVSVSLASSHLLPGKRKALTGLLP